eukprot:2552817-Amphidinium_carterae.1
MDKTIERRKAESNLRQGIKHFRDGQPRSPSATAPFRSQSPRDQRRSKVLTFSVALLFASMT